MNDAQWWQHRFDRLVAECFEVVPFDPAEHEDHELYEWVTFVGPAPHFECMECPVQYRVKGSR